VEKGGKIKVESHPVTFYAFRIGELFSRLRKTGFDRIETNYKKGMANYWVLAKAI
jgi:hypothetical protein